MAEEEKSLNDKGFFAEEQSESKTEPTPAPTSPSESEAPSSEETGQTSSEEAAPKKYLFRMTSPDGSKERQWSLSPALFKFGVFSMAFGSILLAGTLGWTIYSALNFRLNQSAVTDMELATELQQEQLLSLSKKAGKLSEQLQNLTQMESELRIQAGVAPLEKKSDQPSDQPASTDGSTVDQPSDQVSEAPRGDDLDDQYDPPPPPPVDDWDDDWDGQGGPLDALDADDVSEALMALESGIVERRRSLESLQNELKQQRDQIAAVVSQRSTLASIPMQTITMPGDFSGVPFSNAPISNNSFALGLTEAASNVPAIWPTTGVVTSPYGLRWGGTDFHPGIDIANDMGTPIVATADGIVVVAGWNSGGYGNMVDIDHGNGIMTRYGHASQVVVSAGQYVKRGQIIALMGSTGFSTGPHVHYEVHVNGQRVNPISYL